MSIIEVVLALAILSTVLSAVILLVFGGGHMLEQARFRLKALEIAEAMLEETYFQSINNFSLIETATTTESEFEKVFVVENISNYEKNVTAKVTWLWNGLPHGIELSRGIVNWQAVKEGNYCSFPPDLEAWKKPKMLSTLSIDPAGKVSDIDVRKNIAYIAANSAVATSSDLFIVDVSDKSDPKIFSKLHTGPGLAGLSVSGAYAYVANQSLSAGLQIIDIGNPLDPKVVSNFKLPGIAGSGASGIATAISYDQDRIAIGTTKVSGPEFHLIDVSDPEKPTELAHYEIGAGVDSIFLSGNRVYIGSPKSKEVTELDVSDPASVHELSGFDAPLGSGNGKSIELQGDTLYLGRTVGGKELYALDVRQLSPAILSFADVNTSINDLRVRLPLIFLATINSAKEFQVWHRGLDSIDFLASLDLPGRATALDCSGETIFVTVEGDPALMIIGPNQYYE